MNRDSKAVILQKIKNALSSDGVVLVRMDSLNSEEIIMLKKRFWVSGVNFMLMKNSLGKIAALDSGLDFLINDLSGTVVLFYSNDLFTLVKSIDIMMNEYPAFFSLLCGKYLMNYLSPAFIKKCSSVPNEQALYVQLLFTISSPIRNALRIFKRPLINCSKCLKISADRQV